MAPDELQQAWQTQAAETRISINADLLRQEVQRSRQTFESSIRARDMRDIAIALLLLPTWFWLGRVLQLPRTWYLAIPVLVWDIVFTLMYRRRHHQPLADPESARPLRLCVEESLQQVQDQIWLLRNVLWCRILPMSVALAVFFVQALTLSRSSTREASLIVMIAAVITAATMLVVYLLNQLAVHARLEPRRQELLTLLDELHEDFSSDQQPQLSIKPCPATGRSLSVVVSCGMAGLAGILLLLAADVQIPGLDDQAAILTSEDSFTGTETTTRDLSQLVRKLRKKHQLVGLAAIIRSNGKVKAIAVDGERKIDSGVPLDVRDRWHVGGVTQSISCTAIARLIEAERLKWESAIGDCFDKEDIHKDWKPVTIRQLLLHRSGAAARFSTRVNRQQPAPGPACRNARLQAVLDILRKPPTYTPGKKRVYSSVGYTIAGAMVEQITGEIWEDLVRREVLQPLQLADSGFGPPPSTDDSLDHPRGHFVLLHRRTAATDEMDNSPIVSPSATMHLTLQNLSTFAEDHLRGAAGKGRLLSASSYQLLRGSDGTPYGYGWVRRDATDGIPAPVYWNNGSNTMWYALLVFIPELKMSVAVTSNDGDYRTAEAAAWEIVEAAAQMPGLPAVTTQTYPKRAPYRGVRWQKSRPEVRVDNDWFRLISIDDIQTWHIVDFARQEFPSLWRKRFEEDLVEVLSRMGHPPGHTVHLELESLDEPGESIFRYVAMTEDNRQAIYLTPKDDTTSKDDTQWDFLDRYLYPLLR